MNGDLAKHEGDPLPRLEIPEGPLAGRPLKLAPFQLQFVKGALRKDVTIAVLSVARGNAKTMLSSAIALAALLGEIDPQPRRELIIAERTRDQARIAWNYVTALAQSLPDETRARLTFRRQPRYEIEYTDHNGPDLIKAISADGKSALGRAPTFALLDERGHWMRVKATS